MKASKNATDAKLLSVFMGPVRKCARYRPAFGQGRSTGLNLREFQSLYGSDLFYAWLGLDDPVVYAAHRGAGGITSVYRQLGIGCERLFRQVLQVSLGLESNQTSWGYSYGKPNGDSGTHTLDAKVALADLSDDHKLRFKSWLADVHAKAIPEGGASRPMPGAVFEVRQGYKSADSKRQNADLRFGMRAYQASFLPVFALMSNQISAPVVRRYRADGMLVLLGVDDPSPLVSTYAFFEQVVGFDLAGFFQRNSDDIRTEMTEIVARLLTPE